ncbi:MAG: ABC transporter ATP-binding protein [Deltaproteobacteria bacterium]|nr:ABC transporter ATP-binding protein [Deltaproteobacteria bacterium]
MQGRLIEVEAVTKSFGGGSVVAAQDITYSVKYGEIVAILGPSGCGKTTLLRLIAGFEIPDSGRIVIAGQTVVDGRISVPPERRGVGMVFQDYALFPHLTVARNVGFGLARMDEAARARRVEEILELVGLAAQWGRFPHELSGGQQQRVALARALAPHPVAVLLDEPFSNLDADMRAQMRQEVRRILLRANTSAVLVTHDQEEAFDVADRVGVLNHGRLEQLDTPEIVYHLPATRFVADFVGQADFLIGVVQQEGILTEIGLCPDGRHLPPGAQVEVMIRPDDVEMLPSADPNGEIIGRQFRGSENIYAIQLPSGRVVHSTQPSTVIYRLGTTVKVRATPTHLVTFPIPSAG